MSRSNQITDDDIDKIVAEIQQVVHEQLCVGDKQIDASTTLQSAYDELFKPSCWGDDVCPLEVLSEIAEHFGLDWGENRWIVWLELNQKMDEEQWRQKVLVGRTIGDLARFIGSRMKLCRFEPVVILGNPCAPAGAFYGLRDLLDRKKFAPSTPIRDHLNTFEIKKMWSQVQWMSGKSLPQLKPRNPWKLFSVAHWIEVIGTMATIFASLLAIPIAKELLIQELAIPPDLGFPLIGVTFFAVAIIGYVSVMHLAELFHNPLPTDIETFADLSRLIANSENSV